MILYPYHYCLLLFYFVIHRYLSVNYKLLTYNFSIEKMLIGPKNLMSIKIEYFMSMVLVNTVYARQVYYYLTCLTCRHMGGGTNPLNPLSCNGEPLVD